MPITVVSAETEQPPQTPFVRLGGRAVFQRIVDRFYDLIESDSAYAGVRALHGEDLAPMRQSLAHFLSGWAGGPRDWFEANPGRCMMGIHKPYPIDTEVAQQWADAMKRAIADTRTGDAGLAGQMADMLERMAEGLAG